jgi:hypothetical protein
MHMPFPVFVATYADSHDAAHASCGMEESNIPNIDASLYELVE